MAVGVQNASINDFCIACCCTGYALTAQHYALQNKAAYIGQPNQNGAPAEQEMVRLA